MARSVARGFVASIVTSIAHATGLIVAIAGASLLAPPVCAQNQALYLDGNAGGVDVPGTPSLDVQAAYTFEAWIRNEAGAIALRKDGYDRFTYELTASSSWTGIGVNWWHNYQAGSWCNQGNPVFAGPWTHVAASFDGTTLTLYRNGVVVHSCGMPQPASNVGIPLHIGWLNSAYGGFSYLKGWLDEVRIWNVARTAQEICQTINTTIDASHAASYSGLVACWNFDGDATDATGANNGAFFGSATFLLASDIPILDCNGNGVIDSAEIASGAVADCNANGVIDECDIAAGTSADCDADLVPDECEVIVGIYCTSSTTTHGCTPMIAGTGGPNASATSGFNITVSSVEGQKNGLIFYGTSPTAVAWAIGSYSYVCVAPPVQRTAITNSGGTLGGCDGVLTIDFNSFMAANPSAYGSPFMAGEVFYAQGWFRDSGAVKGTNLSNGLQFRLCN